MRFERCQKLNILKEKNTKLFFKDASDFMLEMDAQDLDFIMWLFDLAKVKEDIEFYKRFVRVAENQINEVGFGAQIRFETLKHIVKDAACLSLNPLAKYVIK